MRIFCKRVQVFFRLRKLKMLKIIFLYPILSLIILTSCSMETSTSKSHSRCEPPQGSLEPGYCFDVIIEDECSELSVSEGDSAQNFVFDFSERRKNIITTSGGVTYSLNEANKVEALCIEADSGEIIINSFCSLTLTLYVSSIADESTTTGISLIYQDNSEIKEVDSKSIVKGLDVTELRYSIKEGVSKLSVSGNKSLRVYRILGK